MYIINTIPHGKCFVRYLRTRFCIRNLTRSLRSLVRFLIRQQLVRKYRTPALSMKYSLFIHSGAPRAKRPSEAPWVNKCTIPKNWVIRWPTDRGTDRPSVRTTVIPMFTLTLSSFGSPGESWLHINVVFNWQLSKQGIRWPVLPDRIAGSGVDPLRSSTFWSYPLKSY